MKDKNETPSVETKPTGSKPWYIDFYEFVIAEIDSMLDMLRVR